MTSANEKWQAWMDEHWLNAGDETRRVLWEFWCTAISVGRQIEREKNGRCDDER